MSNKRPPNMASEIIEGEGQTDEVVDIEDEKNTTDEACKELFSLEILPIIKESQNHHGLLHGDYQRYRWYCSRRLYRVKKSLRFVQSSRRHQKKIITPEMITDIRYLYIPLINAERAWAYGMQLKQEANTEARKRFHLLRRLRRAVVHSNNLLQLCEKCVRCDTRSKLEAQAYAAWMLGNVQFEQQQWKEAFDNFGNAQTIYEQLGMAVSEEQRALYSQRVEEITPNVRYCAYNMKDMPSDLSELMKLRSSAHGDEMLASKIDLVLAQTQQRTASTLTEVTWCGQSLSIKSDKLRIVLVRLKELIVEVKRVESLQRKMELYEQLLMEIQDGLQAVKDEHSGLEQAGGSKIKKQQSLKTGVQQSTLLSLQHYLTHLKLQHSIDRNLLLLVTMGTRTAKSEEFIRVYDMLLQYVADLIVIPGLDEDLEVQKEMAAHAFKFKAFRCFHLAQSYVANNKWPEAMALYDRTLDHVSKAVSHYREWAGAKAQEGLQQLQKLSNDVRGHKCVAHVRSILDIQGVEEKTSQLAITDTALLNRLTEYVPVPANQKPVLAPFPPDYQPIHSKPFFFDLALNNIEIPDLSHRVEKKAGGITGFMRGLIWGSSNS